MTGSKEHAGLRDLAMRLFMDRLTSKDEIEDNWYPHADRDIDFYRVMIPPLDTLIRSQLARHTPVRGLDAGCGTGRAAFGIQEAYPDVDMRGVSLVYHPPHSPWESLPREKIKIGRAGHTGYPNKSFDLVIAVGSIDVSDTIVEEGSRILDLVDSGGVFIFAPTIWYSTQEKATGHLIAHAETEGFSTQTGMNILDHPYMIFRHEG